MWPTAFILLQIVCVLFVTAEEKVEEKICLNPLIKEQLEKEIKVLHQKATEAAIPFEECRLSTSRLRDDNERLSASVKEWSDKSKDCLEKTTQHKKQFESMETCTGSLDKSRDELIVTRKQMQEMEEKSKKEISKREEELKGTIAAMKNEMQTLKTTPTELPPPELSVWANYQLTLLRNYDYAALMATVMEQTSGALHLGTQEAKRVASTLSEQAEPTRKLCAANLEKYTKVVTEQVAEAYATHAAAHVAPVLASLEPHIAATLPQVKATYNRASGVVMKTARKNRDKAISALSKSNNNWTALHATEIVDTIIGGCLTPLVLVLLWAGYKLLMGIVCGLLCCGVCCRKRTTKTAKTAVRKNRSKKKSGKPHQE